MLQNNLFRVVGVVARVVRWAAGLTKKKDLAIQLGVG
jgi:hypothetical protein